MQNTTHRVDFTYEGFNRCVRRQIFSVPSLTPVEDRTLTYDGWNLYAESEASIGLLCMYYHGPGTDQVVCRQSMAGEAVIPTLYYHGDALGSIKAVTSSTGDVMAKYRYDSFGRPFAYDANGNVSSLEAWGNRFLFQGREWLAKIRLSDHRNRLYSPDLQRWVNRDPIGEEGGVNLYAFVLNMTVGLTDPLGLSPFKCPYGKVKDPKCVDKAIKAKIKADKLSAVRYGIAIRLANKIYEIATTKCQKDYAADAGAALAAGDPAAIAKAEALALASLLKCNSAATATKETSTATAQATRDAELHISAITYETNIEACECICPEK